MVGDQQLIILQFFYFTLVWCAIPVFLGRPLVDRAFAKWLQPQRALVSWGVLFLRASALLLLFTSTWYLPINTPGQTEGDTFVQMLEMGSILIIAIVFILTIIQPFKTNIFKALGAYLESISKAHIDQNPIVAAKPVKPDLAVKSAIGLSFALLIGMYAIRLYTSNDSSSRVINQLLNFDAVLMYPEAMRKVILLELAEHIVMYVLAVLILMLVVSPLIQKAFGKLREQFVYEEDDDIAEYTYSRTQVIIINASLVMAFSLGYFLPLLNL